MFSGSRPIVDSFASTFTNENEPDAEAPVGVPCRVKVVTRGLALMLTVLLVGLNCLTQASPWAPAAFAASDWFSGSIRAMALRTADGWLYGCSAEGKILVWNPDLSRVWVGGSQGVAIDRAALTPDGTTLGVADADGVVTLWDLGKWRRRADIPSQPARSSALVFSRDSATLATANGLGVRLWDVATANPGAGPRLDLPGVSCLAFDADGRRLAVGTKDGTVRLWDVAQGSQSVAFRAHPALVSSLLFSRDGRVLATSSSLDNFARLWDLATGRLLREWDARSQIQVLAFAPGDRELATAGFDGSVRLWDVATGESRWGFSAGDGPVTALAFSAEGTTLACGGVGAIRLYRLDASSRPTSR
ncbi:WD domain-containing protein, G-beta repeat-containing protein [Singulisphaera sp. GP187]|uniref:WD40 repeat domain-containing protein n=1 Tax=Singulisphaera sp. GP187 TaxID=1882752 RepID=UPI00092C77AF|nr:hypothetical protein [Singulisphaera sp. GP187]SIO43462.1 WD domain-containing protein, G-beta repeat-containing protein [Singulisphaera sp. GP187]